MLVKKKREKNRHHKNNNENFHYLHEKKYNRNETNKESLNKKQASSSVRLVSFIFVRRVIGKERHVSLAC